MTVTTHTYDEQGRLVRSVTTHGARWLPADREALNALMDWKADVHLCGQHLEDALLAPGRSVDEWVGVFDTCLACQAVERDQRAQQKRDDKETLTSGRLWRAMKRADAIALAAQLGMKTR